MGSMERLQVRKKGMVYEKNYHAGIMPDLNSITHILWEINYETS